MNGFNHGYAGGPQIPPYDVDDALQYTPLTSVVPFSPNMIPLPSFTTTAANSMFQSEAERQHTRQALDLLNREAAQNTNLPYLRKCGNDIVTQLANVKTDYVFKSFGDADASATENIAPSSNLMKTPSIGRFGELIATQSNVPFRHASRTPDMITMRTPSRTPSARNTLAPLAARPAAPSSPARPTSAQLQPQPQAQYQYQQHPQPQHQHQQHQQHHQQQQQQQHAYVDWNRSQELSTPIQPRFAPSSTPATASPVVKAETPSLIVKLPYRLPVNGTRPSLPVTPTPLSGSQHQRPMGSQILGGVVIQTPQGLDRTQYMTPTSSQGGSQILGSIVVKPPQDLDRSQYVKYERLDHQLKKSKFGHDPSSSKNRKRKRADGSDDEPLLTGVDQRAKADRALRDLQYLLNSVFEAQDGLEMDTSGKLANSDHSKYWQSGASHGDKPCLATSVQVKLEAALKGVVTLRRFEQISIDDISRLQKLCEGALRNAENERITPPAESSGTEVEDWLAKLSIIDNALKAAKTILRTMLGGRNEKQILSEDILGSVLSLVKYLVEDQLNPMIEMRSGGDNSSVFKTAMPHKKVLGGILHELINCFGLLNNLLEREEVTESALTSIEYVAASIVFIENARDDKDSIFGVQRVEKFRVAAMDILGTIFARHPDQQQFLIGEILTRLEKLPVNRVSARQFKLLNGGKNIQLVSALIMRLVQISGTYQPKKRDKELVEDGDDEDNRETSPARDPDTAVTRLEFVCHPLVSAAKGSAQSIINFIVGRAMRTTKTGDEPYRNLLDIFTEDFLAVLSLPEWPGAELLLRSLGLIMCNIVDDNKQPVTAKAMALDLLGLMGSGISDVKRHLRDSQRSGETGDTADENLGQLIETYFEAGTSGGDAPTGTELEEDLLDWEGPFRIVLEHLRNLKLEDHSLRSSHGYFLTIWSERNVALFQNFRENGETNGEIARNVAKIASSLRAIAFDGDVDDGLDYNLTSTLVKQAYALCVLKMPFCENSKAMTQRLVRSMNDPQATTRSKGLKAFTQLIANDPSVLDDPTILTFLKKRTGDPSALVRDSVIDLFSKCIALRPELQEDLCKTILDRSADTGVQVRKRCVKILKEIYPKNRDERQKVEIATSLVLRMKDNDSGVAELAKKAFEDIWIAPFYNMVGENDEDKDHVDLSSKTRLLANEKVSVIVQVVQMENMLSTMHDVVKSILKDDGKSSGRNFRVCKIMVKSMFEDLLDTQGEDEKTDRKNLMQTLTVFARANSNLFTPDQLVMLEPYIGNLTSQDELSLFKSVVVIYRFALPMLTMKHADFLERVLATLMKNLSRLPAQELREVVSCSWTISSIIGNLERLLRVAISCLTNMFTFKAKTIETTLPPAESRKIGRVIHILGLIAHFCDFEDHIERFKTSFPKWNGDSVAGLIADSIVPFCAMNVDAFVRRFAIEALGHVCQTHAVQFIKTPVLAILDRVFKEEDRDLVKIVLLGLKGFLAREESRAEILEAEGGADDDKTAANGQPGRLTQAAYANQNDGVATSLSQQYLQRITDIAAGSQDGYALIAVEVMGSILRQGLVHPKECVSALVALETSTNPAISQIAFREHKTLHAKHESIVERGYMDGVRRCFEYQRAIVNDPSGATTQPYVSKMRPLYDVLKDGSKKVKKSFLSKLTASIDFDLAKLDVDAYPNHLHYMKFVIENLAFFEYATIDEVYQVITALERVVASTGTTVAHHIETEIFLIKLDDQQQEQQEGAEQPRIDPQKLKVYSAGAGILAMVWATRVFLRKLYNLNEPKCRDYRAGKMKAPDLNKTPMRNPSVKSSDFWEHLQATMVGLDDDGGRMLQCREFVEILSVDSEFKVAAEETDLVDTGGVRETPEADDDDAASAPATPSSTNSRKRKGSAGAPNKPNKPTKRKKPNTKQTKPASAKRRSSKSLERD